jgi:hypothetical protein
VKVQEKLDEIKALVGAARTLPMSSSIIINKAELLRLLDELGELLPDDLALAEAVLSRRDAMLYEATANAERLLTATMEERQRMISEEEVLREARIEAAEVIRGAQDRSERTSREIDEYVDAKLAHLEVAVTNILETVRQGRQRLAEPGVYGELASSAADDLMTDPAPLPRRPTLPEGLLSPGVGAANSGSERGAARHWNGSATERDALPRRGLALEGRTERNADAGPAADAASQQPDVGDRTGRHAGSGQRAVSAETSEIAGTAADGAGWTPRRPETATEADAGEPEADEQSAESAPDAGGGEPPDDGSANTTAEQDGSTAASRPQEARTE